MQYFLHKYSGSNGKAFILSLYLPKICSIFMISFPFLRSTVIINQAQTAQNIDDNGLIKKIVSKLGFTFLNGLENPREYKRR